MENSRNVIRNQSKIVYIILFVMEHQCAEDSSYHTLRIEILVQITI